MAKLMAPNGMEIEGAFESVPGNALINGVTRNPDGTFDLEYVGETEMFWDDQAAVTRDGQRIFLDGDGNQWPENELTLVDDDEEEDASHEAASRTADRIDGFDRDDLGLSPDY